MKNREKRRASADAFEDRRQRRMRIRRAPRRAKTFLGPILINTNMPAPTSLIQPQLLSELTSVILRVFEAIDDGSSRCVGGPRPIELI